MNLVIDAGNTQIKWAVYSGDKQHYKRSSGNWDDFTRDFLNPATGEITAVLISSVRVLPGELMGLLKENCDHVYLLSMDLPLPLIVDYKTPLTLGKDRIAAAAGAAAIYPGHPVLIIDAGTAITFDLITEDAHFIGGNISPGLSMRFKALNSFTDDLPLATPANELPLLGNSTLEAIQAGVQLGITYEIDAYINSLANNFDRLRVILTGGDSSYFVKNLKNTIFVVPDLVLDGLNLVLRYQMKWDQG
jgi:type III pantothenate kinase